MKRKLLEQRDRLLAEIEALKNKVQGLEMALSLVDGEEAVIDGGHRIRVFGTKGTILDLLSEAGTTGLNASSAVDLAERRGIHLDRQSVSSLLSRLKRDGVVVYENERYKLSQYASDKVGGDAPSLRIVMP